MWDWNRDTLLSKRHELVIIECKMSPIHFPLAHYPMPSLFSPPSPTQLPASHSLCPKKLAKMDSPTSSAGVRGDLLEVAGGAGVGGEAIGEEPSCWRLLGWKSRRPEAGTVSQEAASLELATQGLRMALCCPVAGAALSTAVEVMAAVGCSCSGRGRKGRGTKAVVGKVVT